MKKKLFPLALAFASTLFLASCSSDDPAPIQPSTTPTNDSIETIMSDNYYWAIPGNANKSLAPVDFFNSLINNEDKYTMNGKEYRYSRIYEASATQSASYDIGFEYRANVYEDGQVLYVIDYVKPNTPAANAGLKRGFLIKSVYQNGAYVNVSASNVYDLLPNAVNNSGGAAVKMEIADPSTNLYASFDIVPVQGYQENPVYYSSILDVNNGKMGYLVYNMFNAAYDPQLTAALNTMSTVDYLVLDLRFNVGGGQTSARKLGNAVVANKQTSDPFMLLLKRDAAQNVVYPFEAGINPLSNLKKVYVIIGQNTIGIPEVFTNALKPYLADKLTVVGEASQGRNMATTETNSVKPYIMRLVIGKWADKNGTSFGPIQPDISVQEPKILKPLGSEEEAMLAAIIANITGQRTVRSTEDSQIRTLGSSILQKSVLNTNPANVD